MDFLVLGILCYLLDESEKENKTDDIWPWALGIGVVVVPLIVILFVMWKYLF